MARLQAQRRGKIEEISRGIDEVGWATKQSLYPVKLNIKNHYSMTYEF